MGDKLGIWLYSRLEAMQRKPDRILYDNAVHMDLQALEPAGDTSKMQREFVIRKLSICALIIICGVVLSVFLWIKDGSETRIVDNQIERNAYGDGTRNVSLVADDGEENYYISMVVSEKEYSQEELKQMSGDAIKVLENEILGENQSFDRIEYDLCLVRSLPGYPFGVEWRTDDVYMDTDGHLVHDVLSVPVQMGLTAVLTCESYQIEYDMTVRIHSKAVQPDKSERLARQVSGLEENSREQQSITLPSEIENKKVRWSYQKKYSSLLSLAATPILALLIYYSKDRDLHRMAADREAQLRIDYPEIVSALALLLGAGMTVPNAWNKVARDYRQQQKKGSKKRYAYEEMLLTIYEMESGVAQTEAYERFGRRCRIPSYNKMAAMLSQNLRKGTASLPLLLREEAANAFEERKRTARELGEKAGTKLLMPMMMLLGITMLIIMVPAFQMYF